jgi:undecaprenyl-diphosphatase
VTAYLQSLLDFIALHPALAITVAFVVAAGEALLIVGLVVPSTVVLVGIGGLIGYGQLPFWPIFIATSLGAAVGDQVSYWVGHVYKARIGEIWPFSRYRGLLAAGQEYFALHGGKSIVIGRFIPGIKAVVAGVAGMMGMGVIRFTILNVLSAMAWAAVHLLPGYSAGLAFAGLSTISKRLAIVIGVLVVAIVLVVWLAKLAIGLGVRSLPRLQAALVDWANRRHDRLGFAIERLVSPDHADFRLLVILYAIVVGTIIGFAGLLEDVVSGDEIVQLDHAFSQFLQSLRTSWTDPVMIAITMLGDWPVTSAVATVGCIVLLAYRRVRLAVGLGMALVSTTIFVQGMKVIVHAPRPIEIYRGPDAFTFPSGHATVTAALYGVLGFIAFRGSGTIIGKVAVAVCASLIALVAFSRIYLAAHWPSDVAAGLLFGAGVTAGFAVVFRRYEIPRQATAWLLAACTATLLIVGAWHADRGFERALSFYARQPLPAVALSSPWRDGGWKELPAYRIDLAGEFEDPLLLQWRGSPAALKDELLKQGWVVPPKWSVIALNGFAFPNTSPTALPVVPKFHDGRRQAITMVRPAEVAGKSGRLVLRAWTQQAREPGGSDEDILVGSLFFERVDHPLRQMSIPIGAEARACSADTWLSGLPGALLVGQPRINSHSACGGQTVLADAD